MKKNTTYLSVATFEKLQLAITNHSETGMAMELSLVNKFPLEADKLTSMSDTSKLSIFVKYDNPITNTLSQRFLCLVLLGSSKSVSALYKVIVKVFSDHNLNIKNIFFNAFDRTNRMSSSIGGLQGHVCFDSKFSKYINCRSHRFALSFDSESKCNLMVEPRKLNQKRDRHF